MFTSFVKLLTFVVILKICHLKCGHLMQSAVRKFECATFLIQKWVLKMRISGNLHVCIDDMQGRITQ